MHSWNERRSDGAKRLRFKDQPGAVRSIAVFYLDGYSHPIRFSFGGEHNSETTAAQNALRSVSARGQ
jgi:hypothetical protein